MDEKINKILKKVFKIKKNLKDNDSPETVKNWDSLNHLNLIMEVSKNFKIKFSFQDTMDVEDIGKLKKIIKKKIKK